MSVFDTDSDPDYDFEGAVAQRADFGVRLTKRDRRRVLSPISSLLSAERGAERGARRVNVRIRCGSVRGRCLWRVRVV
jgi:hypothetical protein